MEIELKYAIPGKETADRIWSALLAAECTDASTAEAVVMKAVYYDTEDKALAKSNVAFRVRAEGAKAFATVKWGGSARGALHTRGEVNLPVSESKAFMEPPAELFAATEAGPVLQPLIENKALVNLLETRFLRRRAVLHKNESLAELAVDTGSIITDAGKQSICEIELELLKGDVADLTELGSSIAKEFGLMAENRSKLVRGLAMLGLNK